MSTINAQFASVIATMEVAMRTQQQMLARFKGLLTAGTIAVPEVDPEVKAVMDRFGVPELNYEELRRRAGTVNRKERQKRRGRGEAQDRILELLEEVPKQFTRDDLMRVDQGLKPERPLEDWTLNNALLKMVRAGTLRLVSAGHAGAEGGSQSVYEVPYELPARETKARPPRTAPVDVTVRTAPPQFVQGKSAHGNESECTLAMRAAVETLDAEFTMAGLVRQMELMEGNHRVGKWTNAGAVGNQVNYWRTYDVLKIVRREEPHMVAVFVKGSKWEGD